MRSVLVLAILVGCAPHSGSAFVAHYDVEPRALLPAALDATRDMHYQVAALDSKDARHASFLALDGRELPDAEIPAATRAEAEQLMFAIYDRARSDRHFH